MEEAAIDSLPQQDAEPGKAPPERKFHCTFDPNCKSRFSRSEHLQRHIRKHTGERPFKCDCGRTFSRMDNLRQHAQTVHAGDETNLAAWPATKILPVTPVAPLPAEARAQIKVSSDTPNDTPATSKAVSTKPATTSGNKKADTKAESTQRAPGSAGRRSTGSAQRTSDDSRPYPKASERPKRSPRQAATTAAAPAKSGRVATPTRTRERNYESFSSNLSLYRPSILHHLDETASGGVYGKRRSMAQNQNNNTQASSLLLAPLGELRNVPPYHSVRADELPPVVSFDRHTARTLSEAPSARTTQSNTPVNGGLLCRSAQPASSATSSTENSACDLQSTVAQTKRSQSVRGSLPQDRQMSIASLCTTDHHGSSSSNDGLGYSQGEQRSSIDSDKHYASRSVSEGNHRMHYASAPATAV